MTVAADGDVVDAAGEEEDAAMDPEAEVPMVDRHSAVAAAGRVLVEEVVGEVAWEWAEHMYFGMIPVVVVAAEAEAGTEADREHIVFAVAYAEPAILFVLDVDVDGKRSLVCHDESAIAEAAAGMPVVVVVVVAVVLVAAEVVLAAAAAAVEAVEAA